MSDTLPFLSDSEIAGICDGVTVPGWQCKHLARLGLLVSKKPNGRPLVARSEFERVLGAPKPAPEPEPEWMVPPRPAFKDTPLGRWQQAQREAKAANPPEPPPKITKRERARMEKERLRRVAEEHAAVVRHHAAKRRTTKLQRTAAWANWKAIKAIYLEARRLSTATGIPHHVDHIIPLQGKLASGLHVEQNLQILTGSENSKKRNHFEVDP